MKIIKYTKYIILCLVLVITSCEDFTEIEPKGVLSEDVVFRKLDDYNEALIGAYDVISHGSYYGSAFSILPDILADGLSQTPEERNSYEDEYRWVLVADGDPGMWAILYAMLNRLNVVITGIDEFRDEDEQKYNRILAQALSLRAMVHFDLLRWYGVSYDRNNTIEQDGIVVVTEVLPPLARPQRSTVQQTYDQIYTDLDNAENLYGDIDEAINESAGERHFMDLNAMKALRARVSLYAQEWDDAISYAEDVINAIPLASATDFPDMWTDDTFAGENIMSIPFSNADGSIAVIRLLWDPTNPSEPYQGGRSQFTYAPSLVSSYTSSDVRLSSWVADVSAFKTTYSDVQRKYPDNGTDIFSDFKIFRTGEMYLILAEAYLAKGDDNNARRYLNTLREARDPSLSITPGQPSVNIELFIDQERRKELVIEGHRWFDYRRSGRNILIQSSDTFTALGQVKEGITNFVARALQIPASEILANPGIKQNANPSAQ